jgi:trinucleotide repeat-containing gene 6 protein
MGNMMWQQQNKQPYRMLMDLGYRKEDIETALRNSNGTFDDALEVLNNAGRMPQRDPMFGGGHADSGGLYQDSSRRSGFPGPGPGMPPYPGQDPSNSGLVNNSGLPGSFNSPNPMIQKMLPSGGLNSQSSAQGSGLPPSSLSMPPISSTRPQQPNTTQPSAQQLRMLVQQIQMAVQAGHLNPQILNQPLAPQTLLLLNQLLQQIKALQTLQQNHTLAQAQKGSREILSISVNITKTKQHITNLQNQISAQQATYLKSQNMGSGSSGLSGSMPSSHLGGSGASAEPSMPDLFNELTLSGSGSNMADNNVGGSRLSQWKLNANDNLFGNKGNAPKNTSSPGLGFGGDDTWGLSSNSTSSGWPDNKGPSSSNANNDALNGIDAFGIPEFEPGKPWKGPGLKNPDEDPTLTPGSVAPSAIDLMSKTNHNSSTTVENSLGLTSPTWSFNNPTSSDNKPTKDSWSTNSTSTLTPMGQDLWGKSGRTPPGLGGWPSTSNAGSNGWSSGQNGSSASVGGNPGMDQPTWLLLKNLTPQIDGSTLKTLCIQHGPLKNFHLFLNNGIALVMYASGREANKAQKALNNCLLGNTTIQATMTSEAEANGFIQQQQQSAASRGATPSSTLSSMPKSTAADMWGMPATSIYSSGGSSSIWGAPVGSSDPEGSAGQRNTPQLQPYLPGDLLGESNM